MSDLISRQAVDDVIYDYSRTYALDYARIMDYINKIPSVENKGEWVFYDEEFYQQGRFASVHHRIRECSICHHKIADFVGNMNFCPNCGADMRGGK